MSSSTQPLTSTVSELFNILKQVEIDSLPTEVQIDVPPTDLSRSVTGRYKYEVLDDTGILYDSGDWKPNLILNCGLDKVAEMPWAQVFQFAAAGTDPEPTKEPFEETDLTVKLLKSIRCPGGIGGTACWPNKSPRGLIARACTSRREAPDAAIGGTCLQKTFGEHSEVGKLLYLRDQDLQYNVLTSCPVYTVEPSDPEVFILADCSSTLSGAMVPGGNIGGIGGLTLKSGNGYMASLSHDTGLPWNLPGGLVFDHQNFLLSSGDCNVPILCSYSASPSATHTPYIDEWRILSGGNYVNPAVGISIEPPNMLTPQIAVDVGQRCYIHPNDFTILDRGEGLPPSSLPGCDPIEFEVSFPLGLAGWSCIQGDWFDGGGPIDGYKSRRNFYTGNSPHWETGTANWMNILRPGQQQMGKFTNPDVMTHMPNSMKADLCTSFEEFFAKIFVFQILRPPYPGTPGGTSTTGYYEGPDNEWNKMSHDLFQYEGYIPAWDTTLPGTANLNNARNAMMAIGPAHGANPTAGGEPYYWLPYWVANGLTSMDTDTAAGGKAYRDLFPNYGGTWSAFKTAILDVPGPLPLPNLAAKDVGTRGNLFSGIPIKAFKNLPKYTYVLTGDEIDMGCGLLSGGMDVKPSWASTMSWIAANNVNPTNNFASQHGNPLFTVGSGAISPNWIGNTGFSDLGWLTGAGFPLAGYVPPVPGTGSLSGDFIKWNISNEKLVSLEFDFNALYDSIRHPAGHNHTIHAANENSLCLGIDYLTDTKYKPREAAKGELNVNLAGECIGLNLTTAGVGYCSGETPTVSINLPPPIQATAWAGTDTTTGGITGVHIIDPGSGYSSSKPVSICFPEPPPPEIISYDLVLDPVDTYETVNRGHFHDQIPLPSGCYRADIFNTQQTSLFNQYKTHSWYLTGNDPVSNATFCGTDFLTAGNQVAMTRTFDFYMELQPVTYTEIGFKESPAACELFSRISLEPPIKLCAGQYLRLAYQLVLTWEPGDIPRFKKVPTTKDWYNHIDATGSYYLTGYECIQGNGMCIVDQNGIAVPYDITGLANEPYAPGTTNLGPQYGYVNRWYNGDTRLSYPTKEYLHDEENPWLLGGDQVNPPDWAIKTATSPTVNYMPRNFLTYLETPTISAVVPDSMHTGPDLKWKQIVVPSGPELPLERDAFDHWFTKAPPQAKNSITFTNFIPTDIGGLGRWDFLITKGYVADVYPNLLEMPNVFHDGVRSDAWINLHREGETLPRNSPVATSSPGVFMGPVIEYTGADGSLHDPVSVKGSRLSRNVSDIVHPYHTGNKKCRTKELSAYHILFNHPHNNAKYIAPDLEIEWEYCDKSKVKFKSKGFCFNANPPLRDNKINQTWGLTARAQYSDYGSVLSHTQYPVDEKAGGGFTMLDSWSPWTHTPLITSLAAALSEKGPDGFRWPLIPDTAGNWTQAEAIPVAGASAFISTSKANFKSIGSYSNRSQTVSGASKTGMTPIHEYTPEQLSFEVPTFIEDYIPGNHKNYKHAMFETSFGNLTGITSIGLGPTSTTIQPQDMTDAARFNTYLFKFDEVDTDPAYKGFSNLTTYKLNVTFQNVWYRNLKI